MSGKMSKQLAKNVEAAKQAGILELGGTLNDRVVSLVVPRLPLMAQGYAKTPLGRLALANAVNMCTDQFSDDERVAIATEAMIQDATNEVVRSLKIREIVSEVFDEKILGRVAKAVESED